MILKVLACVPEKLQFSFTKMRRLGEEQGGGEGDAKLVFLAKLRRI